MFVFASDLAASVTDAHSQASVVCQEIVLRLRLIAQVNCRQTVFTDVFSGASLDPSLNAS